MYIDEKKMGMGMFGGRKIGKGKSINSPLLKSYRSRNSPLKGDKFDKSQEQKEETGSDLTEAETAYLALLDENKNFAEGIDPQDVEAVGYDPTHASAGTLGGAPQAELGFLAGPQTYTAAKGRAATLGAAGQTDVDFHNPFNALQVATEGARFQARESDRAFAQVLAQNRRGGGAGSTALAAAALGSKAGIGASISQQEAQNELQRAGGAERLQGREFGQEQFNVGQANLFKTKQFDADNAFGLANLAAENQARAFNANAANTFSLQNFLAENRLSEFNTGITADFTKTEYLTQADIDKFNANASNISDQFYAGATNEANALNQKYDFEAQVAHAEGAAAQFGRTTDFHADYLGFLRDRFDQAYAQNRTRDPLRDAPKLPGSGGGYGTQPGGYVGGVGGNINNPVYTPVSDPEDEKIKGYYGG